MKILQLNLKNFQGIKSKTVTFDQVTNISGDNATGKTTIGNAVTWVLYGSSLDHIKNFSPKPYAEDGQKQHNIETSAELTILNHGIQTVLKKTLKENWVKKRGEAQAVFSGNVIECEVNGVPYSVSNYNKFIDSICKQDQAKILTNPLYFATEIPWKERRETLLGLCNDITDKQILMSDPKFMQLEKAMTIGDSDELYTIDEYVAKIKSSLKKANASLQDIPVRID